MEAKYILIKGQTCQRKIKLIVFITTLFVRSFTDAQPRGCDRKPPEKCTCWTEHGEMAISCNYAGFDTFPSISGNELDMYLAKLELSDNSISEVDRDDMEALCISQLDLSYNQVTHVDENAFYTTRSCLNDLDLSHNRLSEIGPHWHQLYALEELDLQHNHFDDLPSLMKNTPASLKQLYLHGNHLKAFASSEIVTSSVLHTLSLGPVDNFSLWFLENDKFRDLKFLEVTGSEITIDVKVKYIFEHMQLTRLKFSDCTFTQEEDDSIFENLRNSLSELAIRKCNLASIPKAVAYLELLHRLNLEGNNIRTIESGDFKGPRNLEYLYLKNNAIHTIHEQAFSELKYLRHLDLSGNDLNILTIDAFHLPALSHLNDLLIGHNPWLCVCSMKWVIDSIHDELEGKPGPFQKTDIYNASCEYKGMKGLSFETMAKHNYDSYGESCN